MAKTDILELLEPFRIDDKHLAEAYEWAGAQFRALLKTAISLIYCYFDRIADKLAIESEYPHLGIKKKILTYPKKQNILIFDSEYRAAARICSAALMPLIAGASPAISICVDGKPSKAALCGLDLGGICDVYQLNTEQAEQMVIRQLNRTGSIVFLHNGSLQKLVRAAKLKQLSIYEEYAPPKLLLASPKSFSIETLRFLHGIEQINIDLAEDEFYDAIFIDTLAEWQKLPARLIIEPQNEGFWLFPNLSIDLFRQICTATGIKEDTSGKFR